MDCSERLKRRPTDQPHPGTRSIYPVRIYLAQPHLPLELLNVELRLRLMAPNDVALAMDDLLVCVLAVDLIVDLVVVACQQCNADLLVRRKHERLPPDDITQLQPCFLRTTRSFLYGYARHLQASHGRKNPNALRLMIFQEKFFATESCAITLLAQIRGVAVQQWMKDSCYCIASNHRLAHRRIDPIALLRKRIGGKADTPRPGCAVYLAPIHIQTFHPHLQQLGDF